MNIFKQFTNRSLKENKTRTVVTIIGIILSVAMFTATTEAFVTVQNYLVNYAEMYNGKYHVGFYNVEHEDVPVITGDERVEKYTYVQDIGYAEIGSTNEFKPYLYIAGVPVDYTDIMPVHMIEGRLPENSSEIVVSYHLVSNGGVKLELGQKITLEVGQRQWKELIGLTEEERKEIDAESWQELTQQIPLRKAEGEEASEQLTDTKEKTYTVVGFCVRPDHSVEPYEAPGYTAFTLSEAGNSGAKSIYTVLKAPGKYNEFYIEKLRGLELDNGTINHDLLMYSFQSNDSAFSALVFGLLAILIGLIVFGSVSLIYNSFSISVSERTKQFGILKSIGATKKQIRKSVLYEAAVLCLIGIPIGLVSGCLGIAITFHFLSDSISTFLAELTDLKMQFVFSPLAILAASVIGFVTVIISAYIPARKAIKINPIESVRQSNDVKINRRSVKVSPLTQKLFGFEATLSSKNFKRNKRKYRTTVFSLFVSVVLFISASSLATYFTDIIDAESQVMNYDVAVFDNMYGGEPYDTPDEFGEKLYDALKAVDGIDEFAITQQMSTDFNVDKKYISEEYLNMIEKEEGSFSDGNTKELNGLFHYNFIDDDAFRRLLKKEGISEEGYFDKENPKALVYDKGTHIYQTDGKEKVYIVPFLDKTAFPATLEITEILPWFEEADERYYYEGTQVKDGITYYVYDVGYDEGDIFTDTNKKYLTEKEAVNHLKISVGAFLSEKPYFAESNTSLIYPESVKEKVMLDGLWQTHTYIICEDHSKVTDDVSRIVNELGGEKNNMYVTDYAAEIESIRALVTIAKVLAYGFIVLISMIAAANVFNTISTNISLRRREFATLKSVGLTSKGMRRMMTFESVLYGVKSLMFSLPVSLAMTYLIYLVASDSGYEMGFYVPWDKFIIAIASVFIIVVLSMVYSIKKVNKENTVETLRNENI